LRAQGLERSNAARTSAAGEGWTEPNLYFLLCRKCKQVLVPLPEKFNTVCYLFLAEKGAGSITGRSLGLPFSVMGLGISLFPATGGQPDALLAPDRREDYRF